jgi:hypothetical protein
LHQPAAKKHQSFAWFSADGREWSAPVAIGEPDFWLWRASWHADKAYGVGYHTSGERLVRLYESADGSSYKPQVERLFDRGFPNEASIAFLPDDTALCLLRRDGTGPEASAQLGTSHPPYTDWTWKDLGRRLGGPNLLPLPDGRIIAAGRLHDRGPVRAGLCWLDPAAGTLEEFLTLPSGGDCSYPGLVWHDGELWVSYYSSHEGRTSIYLARVKIPAR